MAAACKNYSRDSTVPVSIYYDICAKLSKLGSEILTKISWVKIEEGKERYHRFVDNGHKWLEDDYEHEGFQVIYCQRLFVTRAEMICYVLLAFDANHFLPNLFYDTNLKARTLRVASFGCGPGSDLAGFEAFYSNLKICYINSLKARKGSLSESYYSNQLKCLQEAKIDPITGYDSAIGWGRFLEVLGYSYKHQVIDCQFVHQMEPVDVVILSYFAHNAHFSSPLDPPQFFTTVNGDQDFIRNWDILMQKSKLIIVLDAKICKIPLFSLLTMRGFGTLLEGHDSDGREVSVHVWSGTELWK